MKLVKSIAYILVFASLLVSCSGSLVNLKYDNGQLVNKRMNLAYTPAPTTYQPVSVGEPYAFYGKSEMTLYEIKGLDPKEWLTQEYLGSATTVFYSDETVLPELGDFGVTQIIVCSNEEITYAIATIDDTDVINALITEFETGTPCEWPLIDAVCTYDMKFKSEELYPHLYYNLIYGEFPEGKFLYDRNSKHCVNIGTILDAYITE